MAMISWIMENKATQNIKKFGRFSQKMYAGEWVDDYKSDKKGLNGWVNNAVQTGPSGQKYVLHPNQKENLGDDRLKISQII